MTVASKLLPVLHKNASCGEIFHPWASRCSTGALMMWWESVGISSRFFAAVYLFQFLSKNKKDYKYLIKSFIRSVLHASLSSCVFVYSNCLGRNNLKRFNRYWIGFGCGFLAGLPVFFETPSRINLVNITFLNMVLDMLFRMLDQKGWAFLTESLRLRLILFIFINSTLLYKLKKNSQNRESTLWFFTPSESNRKGNEPKTKCHHIDSCWRNIGKSACMYFALGTGIQLAKMVLYSGRLAPPKLNDLSFAIFAASYVGLYKAITCALYRYRQEDSPAHAFVGGLVSGAALSFYPSRSIFIAALGNLIKIFAREFKETKELPDLPYAAITYAIFNGLLYHARILQPEICPNSFILIINLITRKRAQWIYTSFQEKVAEAIKANLTP